MSYAGAPVPAPDETAAHVRYDDSAHCREDGEPWPCLVVRLAEQLAAARAALAGGEQRG